MRITGLVMCAFALMCLLPAPARASQMDDRGARRQAEALPVPATATATVSNLGTPSLEAAGTPQPDAGCQIAPSDDADCAPPQGERAAVIYLFWGDGCPHCAAEKPFLEQLAQDHPGVEIRAYEVWSDEANREKLMAMAAAFGFEPRAVPTTFLGDQHWVGYTDQMGEEIKQAVLRCLETGCQDAGAGVIAPVEPTPLPAALAPQSTAAASAGESAAPAASATAMAPDAAPAAAPLPASAAAQPASLTLPLIGAVSLENQSLAVSTALIAFVDGFNPCSLWVLTMLLAITLHTGSRKKVLIIGLVFLSVTAAVYALFIAGLFTVFTFAGFTGWIQAVVALVALFFAAVNIKDYFWYKEGFSLTIADSQKPGLFQRMRGLVDASQSFWGLLSATVVLAAGVSLVEFSCTAGFPMLWTNLLSSQQVGAATFVALLALYMLIYQLDELGVFFVSVFTLKAARLEEKHGRILKLAGGMLMLTLAVVMLANPSLMNDLGSSLLIFGAALGATLLVLLAHRVVLPRFGIWVGSEANSKQARRGDPQGAAPRRER